MLLRPALALVFALALATGCGRSQASPQASAAPSSSIPPPPSNPACAPSPSATEHSGQDAGPSHMFQIMARDRAQFNALDIIHLHGVRGLSDGVATQMDDGRVATSGDATEEAIAIMRARGCSAECGCDLHVSTPEEEAAQLARWRYFDACEVDRGDAAPEPGIDCAHPPP